MAAPGISEEDDALYEEMVTIRRISSRASGPKGSSWS
jgi:hypothetical protein